MDMKKLMGDQDHIKENLFSYIQAFSPSVRDIFERFDFYTQIERLAKAGLLYQVSEKFANVDLHPEAVSNGQMGLAFEELIRKFAELSNETAGEHFTPREVIRLMVNLLFIEDDEVLTKPGIVRTMYDPTAGTGGMLSVGGEHLAELNPKARLTMFGQELNDESYAICKADMLIKGQDVANIVAGNTLSDDGHPFKTFDYMLSNPPFGVEWKKVEKEIRKEYEQQGFNGRFGPGLPRVSDGSLLFLLHTSSARCARRRMAAAASVSSSTVHPFLPAARGAVRARFAAMCWKMIWWKQLLAYPRICSTTPASAPIFGYSATESRSTVRVGCN
jgi:type I restriction enzyme M protein